MNIALPPYGVAQLRAVSGAGLFSVPWSNRLIWADDMEARAAARDKLKSFRRKLLENGYLFVPVLSADAEHEAAGKGVTLNGWQKIYETGNVALAEEIHRNHAGTGLLAGKGQSPLAPIDIDVLDKNVCEEIQALAVDFFGYTPLARIGRAPKILFIYRFAAGIGKRQTQALFLPDASGGYDVNGCAQKVEVLGTGNQFVAAGIHPKTHEPYYWLCKTPLEVAAHELPLVTEQQVLAFLTKAEDILRAAGGKTKAEIEHKASPTIPGCAGAEANEFTAYADSARVSAEAGTGKISDSDLTRDALTAISSDDYDTWVTILAALKGSSLPDAREIAEEWSRRSPKFNHADFEKKWDSFKGGNGRVAKLGTVLEMAKLAGWANPLKRAKPVPKESQDINPATGKFETIGAAKATATEIKDADSSPPVDLWRAVGDFRMGYGSTPKLVRVKTVKAGGGSEVEIVDPVSAPFVVEGYVRDTRGEEPGLLISWRDDDGCKHEIVICASDLHAEPAELARRLEKLHLHVEVNRDARVNLQHYFGLVRQLKNLPRLTTVAALGFHTIRGKRVFVLPDRAYGDCGERVITAVGGSHAYNQSGDLDSWKREIAERLAPHKRGVLALSIAFAGPIIGMVERPGFGIHLNGQSGSGKTVLLQVAASVWGRGSENSGDNHKGFVRTWSATDNAIENVARAAKDTLLVLDELGRGNPQTLGKAVYALIGGTPKSRQMRDGGERQQENWRVAVLSSGEMALSTAIEAGTGKHAKAGMQTRIVELRAQVPGGSGVYDDPTISVRDFSVKLANAAITHYGFAGAAFVERMMDDQESCRARFDELEAAFFSKLNLPANNGQLGRVASLFATVAAAGELAAEFGILPFPTGIASEAAQTALSEWRAANGADGANDVPIESRQAIAVVRREIESWGESKFAQIVKGNGAVFMAAKSNKAVRFSGMDAPADGISIGGRTPIDDVAVNDDARSFELYGYLTEEKDGKTIYCFQTEVLRSIFKRVEMDPLPAIEALNEAGLLATSPNCGNRYRMRVDKGGPVKFYAVRARILED